MRRAAAGVAMLALFVGVAAAQAPSAARQQLTGVWRLLRIDYIGPDGPAPDPFYQQDSDGLLIYDASGWMSVEIGAPHRGPVPVPESRIGPAAPGGSRARAAAFDSYYAYFGTWTCDPTRAVITHHVESSLIPSENGVDYRQEFSLDGDRLTFVNRLPPSRPDGPRAVRRKVWRRVSAAGAP